MTELRLAWGEPSRGALVPTARTLVAVNSAILAYFAWYVLPIDNRTSAVEHALFSGFAFAVMGATALVAFGGWKAACLSLRWRTEGSLVWAWAWLALYAGYGAFLGYAVINHTR